MKIARQIIVFDAPDLDAESAFWAALYSASRASNRADELRGNGRRRVCPTGWT